MLYHKTTGITKDKTTIKMYFFYEDKKQEKISLNFLRSPERYFIKIKVTYLFEASYINKNKHTIV